jgi:hypothetical protein
MCQVFAGKLSINNRTDKLQIETNSLGYSRFLLITYQTIPEIPTTPDIFSKFVKLLKIYK